MKQSTLKHTLEYLEHKKELVSLSTFLDPNLEIPYIHRRVFENQGPALWFKNVKGSNFSCASNIFGSKERMNLLFPHKEDLQFLLSLKSNPLASFKSPLKSLKILPLLPSLLPRKMPPSENLFTKISISDLPFIKSWPKDGGPFVTLPQVYSESPLNPGWKNSNLGMYRIQLAGNQYKKNKEIGLHYQIHRGIGIHHTEAQNLKELLKISIFIGGHPGYSVSAVMPLPEKLPELIFSGLLTRRRFAYGYDSEGFLLNLNADFCITGTIDPNAVLPEGPFGDHLGYYSLEHPFPFLKIHSVYAKQDAIYPFTVVGRPPQEDTAFGDFIHELTGSLVETEIPGGVKALHAVDVAGVHPLLLAIGQERYTPYLKEKTPMETLTAANALLGFGQCSLTKYLLISAYQDNPNLNVRNLKQFFTHILERVNFENDLHFQTRTTMDTLDYTGSSINKGSKVVIAGVGKIKRKLSEKIHKNLTLPNHFKEAKIVIPGVMVIQAPPHKIKGVGSLRTFCSNFEKQTNNQHPLIVLVDNSAFASQSLEQFIWVTFTRSDPAQDIDGLHAFTENKHWGCKGSLVIDSRIKKHHAPILEEDPKIVKKIESLAVKGKPLHGLF